MTAREIMGDFRARMDVDSRACLARINRIRAEGQFAIQSACRDPREQAGIARMAQRLAPVQQAAE
jgi:hypothetical protein